MCAGSPQAPVACEPVTRFFIPSTSLGRRTVTLAQAGLFASGAASMLIVLEQPLKRSAATANNAIFFIKNRLPLVCE
jgi:hypothetical protein